MATIDERLEALTHTVELLAGMQIETEKLVQNLIKTQEETARMQIKTEQGLNRLRRYALTIALDHETRLSRLEKLELDEDNEPPTT
jgi:hypothetical protein